MTDKRRFNIGRPRQEFCNLGHNDWLVQASGKRACRVCRNMWEAEDRKKIKVTVISAYGGKCVCCGEARVEFLSIDHIDGNGNTHRKQVGVSGGHNFYRWLAANKFPEQFRILCYNCNCSRGFVGYCPHEMMSGA